MSFVLPNSLSHAFYEEPTTGEFLFDITVEQEVRRGVLDVPRRFIVAAQDYVSATAFARYWTENYLSWTQSRITHCTRVENPEFRGNPRPVYGS